MKFRYNYKSSRDLKKMVIIRVDRLQDSIHRKPKKRVSNEAMSA